MPADVWGLFNQEVEMKKPKLDDFELFYMAIPQTDYLNDIDLNADEDNEPPSYNKMPNLSDKQVSELAVDQLESLERPPIEEKDNDQTSLFSKPIPQD